MFFRVFGPKRHVIWGFWAILSLRVNVDGTWTSKVAKTMAHIPLVLGIEAMMLRTLDIQLDGPQNEKLREIYIDRVRRNQQ